MRAVLLRMESADYGEHLDPSILYADLNFSENEIKYSILKLKEAGYISALVSPYEESCLILELRDITFAGHEFLANIRTDKIWLKVKDVCRELGASSLASVVQISANVMSEYIRSSLKFM